MANGVRSVFMVAVWEGRREDGLPVEFLDGFFDILGIQFDAHITASQGLAGDTDRPASEERVEHEVIRPGGSQQAGRDQVGGEGSDVVGLGRAGVDAPDGAAIPTFTVLRILHHGCRIVGILLLFGEHEEILVSPCGPVLDALRHDVGFVPDDVAAEKPTVILKRERQPPRHAQQILVLEPGWIVWADVHGAVRILLVGRAPSPVPARVAVTDVEPEHTVRLEHPPDLGEDRRERVHVAGQGGFQPNLPRDAVIAERPIRRRSHHALHAIVREPTQSEANIALDDGGVREFHPQLRQQLDRVRTIPRVAVGRRFGKHS